MLNRRPTTSNIIKVLINATIVSFGRNLYRSDEPLTLSLATMSSLRTVSNRFESLSFRHHEEPRKFDALPRKIGALALRRLRKKGAQSIFD
jgi:hypothetical protein